MSLPAADELFRSTGGSPVQPSTPQQHSGGDVTAVRLPAPSGEPVPADGHAPAADDAPDRGAEAAGSPGSPGNDADGHSGRGSRQSPQGQLPGQAGQAAPARNGQATAEGRRAASQPVGGTRGQSRSRAGAAAPARRGRVTARRPSGRERHDEKITVYVSAEELMDLEHARLVLRGEHGLAVDRGRIVREAVAVVLADLESRGDASILVRRLRGS
ncbi:hypothetical protein CUT44_24455 [Streptomyces carminius]|uniref:Cobyrinic acid a,c-diamide synthase n=1 Tax=Streptomyces carminius TaxID=2665496 RepID=A0A2M8LSB1_9ACTN|nr:hypothetical protein [Streptomyces carminius]PJE94852.1 hypothetical protein CUT44_24455 [Streptomyces carminius]